MVRFPGPARDTRPIIDRLNQAVNDIIKDPKIDEQMVFAGADPVGGSPEQFKGFHRQGVQEVAESG